MHFPVVGVLSVHAGTSSHRAWGGGREERADQQEESQALALFCMYLYSGTILETCKDKKE